MHRLARNTHALNMKFATPRSESADRTTFFLVFISVCCAAFIIDWLERSSLAWTRLSSNRVGVCTCNFCTWRGKHLHGSNENRGRSHTGWRQEKRWEKSERRWSGSVRFGDGRWAHLHFSSHLPISGRRRDKERTEIIYFNKNEWPERSCQENRCSFS